MFSLSGIFGALMSQPQLGPDYSQLPPPPPAPLTYPKRMTQAEAVKQFVPIELANQPKFCMYCGSYIPDQDLRRWHTQEEHHGATSQEMIFCINCGDYIGPDGVDRAKHYTNHRVTAVGAR